jgi:rod shape-determining protein MreB
MICVPSGVGSAERRRLTEAAISAGARQAWLIDPAVAAALGAGLPIAQPRASAICDVGAGLTEIAVIANSGTVVARSLAVAGNRIDSAIVDYIRQAHNMDIGERGAEGAKIAAGSAVPMEPQLITEVLGRDSSSRLTKTVQLTTNQMLEAIEDCVRSIASALREVADETPARLAADVLQGGVVLTGGGARLRGLDRYLSMQTGIPARLAEEPETSVVRGAGLALESFEVLKHNHSYVR